MTEEEQLENYSAYKGEAEEQLAGKILTEVSVEIVKRSVGAGDSYFSLVNALASLSAPVYVLGIRLISTSGGSSLSWWHCLPVILLLGALVLSSWSRFPRTVMYDFNNPVQIYETNLETNRKMRVASIFASLLGGSGLLMSLYLLASL